jgi:hypothetical protein
MATAAPGQPAGRRSQWPTLLLTAGFVIGGPPGAVLFLAGPVLVLLALSRPRRLDEWFWVIATALTVGIFLRGTPSLTQQTSRAAAAFFAGALAVSTLLGIRALSDRLLLSVGAATGATVAWFLHLGVRFRGLRAELVMEMWSSYRVMFPDLPPTPLDRAMLAGLSESARGALPAGLSANVQVMGDLYPGILVVTALVGGWLAWGWYYRIAAQPLGAAPRALSELRFNDHLVWLLIGALALTVLHVPGTIALVASNLLFVLGALYWARGLAITRYTMARLPAPPLFKVAVTALLVLPLAFGGWLLIGVADTWLDIRRRLEPPQGVLP